MPQKPSKKQRPLRERYDFSQRYPLEKALQLLKEAHTAKFDASVDAAVNLGVDPKKADQLVRGVVTLPHGTGKVPRVLVLCTPEKQEEAKQAGADYVGLESYLEQIGKGWVDFDVIVTMPAMMAKLAKLGKLLGPRGLMPNPKNGTVTTELAAAIKAIKAGKITFKVDKAGIVHVPLGRISFAEKKLQENVQEFMGALKRLKPSSAKGAYIKRLTLATTMGPGVHIDLQTIATS